MQGLPEPRWTRANDHIPITSYELPQATHINGGVIWRWYFNQEREIWHRVAYNHNDGVIVGVSDLTLEQMLRTLALFSFTGFDQFLNMRDLDLNKYPVGINIDLDDADIPRGYIVAGDGNSYTWREIVIYLWTYMRNTMQDLYGINISYSAAHDFEIFFDPNIRTFRIHYIGH